MATKGPDFPSSETGDLPSGEEANSVEDEKELTEFKERALRSINKMVATLAEILCSEEVTRYKDQDKFRTFMEQWKKELVDVSRIESAMDRFQEEAKKHLDAGDKTGALIIDDFINILYEHISEFAKNEGASRLELTNSDKIKERWEGWRKEYNLDQKKQEDENAVGRFRDENRSLRTKIKVLEKRLASVASELDSEKNEFNNYKTDQAKKVDELNAALAAKAPENTVEIERLRAEQKRLTAELETLKNSQKQTALESEERRVRNNQLGQRNDELFSANDGLKKENVNLKTELNAKDQQSSAEHLAQKRLEGKLSEANSRLSSSEKEIERLTSEVKGLEERNERTLNTLNQLSRAQRTEAGIRPDPLTSESRKTSPKQGEREPMDRSEEVARLRGDLTKAQEKAQLEVKNASEKESGLAKALEQANERNRALAQELERAHAQLKGARSEIARQKDPDPLRAILITLQKKNESYLAEYKKEKDPKTRTQRTGTLWLANTDDKYNNAENLNKDIEVLRGFPNLEAKHIKALLKKYETLEKKAMGALSIPGRVHNMLKDADNELKEIISKPKNEPGLK